MGFGRTGCGSYEVLGQEGMAKALIQVAEDALNDAGLEKSQISGMGFGIAGYDWPSEEKIMVEAIEALDIQSPYKFANDAVIGLLAGASEGWGIAVDAGTGNNVRGRDQSGKVGRITGNGALFGEIGGAAEMVWLAQVAVTYAWSNRGPNTKLTQLFFDYANVHSEGDLIEGLAMEMIRLSPSLARDIFQLAADGDEVAGEIVNYCATELGCNVNAVIRQLNIQGLTFDIVLIGSVFKAGEIYIRPFRETIHEFAPGAHLISLSIPPVVGSIVLAAEVVGLQDVGFRTQLIKSVKQ